MVFETSEALQLTMSKAQASTSYEAIAQDPLKHVLTVIEKKVRNLDKRKVKLDGYRKVVSEGVALDPDQESAVEKYKEVIGSLDFAKELCKAFSGLSVEVSKTHQMMIQRENIMKEENALKRSQFVAKALLVLRLFSVHKPIQQDFLTGSNNAVELKQNEMELLLRFCDSCLGLADGRGKNLLDEAEKCGEHLHQLYEASTESICGSSYDVIHSVFMRICACGYFEDLPDFAEPVEVAEKDPDGLRETPASSLDEDDELTDDQDGYAKEGMEVSSMAVSLSIVDEVTTIQTDDVSETREHEETDLPSQMSKLHCPEVCVGLTRIEATTTPAYPEAPQGTASTMQSLQQNSIDFLSFQCDELSKPPLPVSNSQQTPNVRPSHTIEEVLAGVQGEYNFLQDSMIDLEGGNHGIPYVDQHPLPHTNQKNTSNMNQLPISNHHNSVLQPSPYLSVNNSTETSNSFLPPNGPNITSSDMIHHSTQNQSNPPTNSSFNSHVYPGQEKADSYTGNNLSQGSDHQVQPQVDNLGMGQTTFGSSESNYEMTSSSTTAFGAPIHAYQNAQSEVTMIKQVVPDSTYGSTNPFTSMHNSAPPPFEAPIPDPIPMPSLQQIAPQSLTTPDPPTTHIPFPNEKMSGYTSYNSDPSKLPNKAEITISQKNPVTPYNERQEEHRMCAGDAESTSINPNKSDVNAVEESSKQAEQITRDAAIKDVSTTYGSANKQSVNQSSTSGSMNRQNRMQSGSYSNSGGNYRTNLMSRQQGQGMGGYYQRGGNYRSTNNRNYGNFDSMGHPKHFGPNDGYQQHPQVIPPFNSQYNRPQDSVYGGMQRRGGSGGSNRGRGYASRGNMRNGGSGNYNRSRTFRPQNSEQAT